MRLENLWSQIEKEFPTGNVFEAESPEYENRCRSYEAILDALPSIDGWMPTETPLSLSDVNYQTIDAREVGDVESQMALHDRLSAPGRELREYRFRLTLINWLLRTPDDEGMIAVRVRANRKHSRPPLPPY